MFRVYPGRVTLITDIPVVRDPDGLLSAPVYLTVAIITADGIDYRTQTRSVFGIRDIPKIALTEPGLNEAWCFTLSQLGRETTRNVTFSGAVVTWNDLTEVDPTTLHPVPADEALAEWAVVRDEILTALDLPDLTITFENGIV